MRGKIKMEFDEVELRPLNEEKMNAMQQKIDDLAKPVKGLGRLEELADHLAGIYRTTDFNITPRKCLVFCS